MALDQELVQAEVTKTSEELKEFNKFLVGNSKDIFEQYNQLINKLHFIILKQGHELSLFHLLEAHIDAGKVGPELWDKIKEMLVQLRGQK